MKRLFTCVFLLVRLMLWGQDQLTQGSWYQVAISADGLYRIDRQVLNGLGIDVNGLNPAQVGLYGAGFKGMLPQSNATSVPNDLVPIPSQLVDGDDGHWDAEDYLIFYGYGPDASTWTIDGLVYEKNIYAEKAFYYLRMDDPNPTRLAQATNTAEGPLFTHYRQALIWEEDDNNLLKSGRIWYGRNFSTNAGLSESYTFNLEDEVAAGHFGITVGAQSEQLCGFRVAMNGTNVADIAISPVAFGPGATYNKKAITESRNFIPELTPSKTFTLTLDFEPAGSPSTGFLDRWTLEYLSPLTYHGSPLTFHVPQAIGTSSATFELSTAPENIEVWQLNGPANLLALPISMVSGTARFNASTDSSASFVAFAGAAHPRPVPIGPVVNQQLTSGLVPDGLIITHPNFMAAAQRLADFHRNQQGLFVKVVTTEQVYHQFSAGRQDLTAMRNYIRLLHSKQARLRYVTLFGDASYDYKDRTSINTNFLPIYESYESFDPIFSYASDDYLGFLEEGEGNWPENLAGDHTLEIGIGRLPVTTTEEAHRLVDKIIRYTTSVSSMGTWRQQTAYIVDDGDANIHVDHAERLNTLLDTSSNFLSKKIYLDSYEQDIGPSGERAPEMSRSILDAFDAGALMIDFIGHGNEQLWMDEQVLTFNEIDQLRNFEKLPLLITATCEFGRYDDPIAASGAERLLTSNAGAIGLLTTTRPVFANTNFEVNRSFHEAFTQVIQGADVPRLGDLIRVTKNNSLSGPINRNFTLLGDPMMKLAYPTYNILLEDPVVGENDTLSALEPVTISGRVVSDGQPVDDFNGEVTLTIWDQTKPKRTFGQQSLPVEYFARTNVLFRGKASVVDGVFTIDLVVPLNITYNNEVVKLSFYAVDESNLTDASGADDSRRTGGTYEQAAEDTTPPTLYTYLNDSSFRSGQQVGASPLLMVQFFDDHGIGISNNGFDRGITLNLNGEIIELNDYYVGRTDDYRYGTVLFNLDDLAPGRYRAEIKAADTYNNSTTQTVEFVVSDELLLRVFSVDSYPNPASDRMSFLIRHERSGEPLNVQLSLVSLEGMLVHQTAYELPFSSGQDVVDVSLPSPSVDNGMYFYRLDIQSPVDGASNQVSGRILIRN